ncbi:hypothetical protein EVAR_27951_1 [Eumeta japonica]|uniref:Uncharacterized protein n=1 Tax=Eumeta variegata TaxID=151549 RepID=A0A4C1UWE4_EUMVA|nr:hypothetical protein EVAR_27951_1 [Eumeta japonica]
MNFESWCYMEQFLRAGRNTGDVTHRIQTATTFHRKTKGYARLKITDNSSNSELHVVVHMKSMLRCSSLETRVVFRVAAPVPHEDKNGGLHPSTVSSYEH